MIIKTKDFQDTCKIILPAVDDSAANLELCAKDGMLRVSVTNREYYVSAKYAIESNEEFLAVVDAVLFLNLIAGITTETFEILIDSKYVMIKSGKSKYKAAMIYENDKLMTLPVIKLENKNVEMPISVDILRSILNVNSKEVAKGKNLDVLPLQKMYYVTEEGCFTFTSGACLNSFSLAKPVKMLLSDRVVKLFKLFNTDVLFSLGHDQIPGSNTMQTKAIFETDSVYVGAVVVSDPAALNNIIGPYTATKNLINEKQVNNVVVSANALSAALNRLMLFTKNSIDKVNMASIPAKVTLTDTELTITDKLENSEVITIENNSYVGEPYEMVVNLADLKFILDSCHDEHITINCGNHRSVVIARGNISNLIPEGKRN